MMVITIMKILIVTTLLNYNNKFQRISFLSHIKSLYKLIIQKLLNVVNQENKTKDRRLRI